jgi:hypothetical protein
VFFIRKGFVFLFFLFILFNPSISKAQDLSFKTDPSKVRLIISPSGSQAGTIKVYSQSTDKIKIKVYLEDWVYIKVQDGTKEFFPAKSTPLSCSDWITFNPSEFILLPFGVQTVNYIARIPPDAKGGYYTVMFFETSVLRESENKEGSEVTKTDELRAGTFLNIRLGTLFYVEAKDTVKRLAELGNFSLSKDKENKSLLITSDFKNIGNVDITAGGTFHIIDKEGMVMARGEFNNVYTFPADTAKLSATWKELLPKGRYDLILTLDLGKALEELEMGRGPVITQETEIEIGENGEVIKVGELK